MSSETPQAEQCDGPLKRVSDVPLEEQVASLRKSFHRLARRIELMERHSHTPDGRCVVPLDLVSVFND